MHEKTTRRVCLSLRDDANTRLAWIKDASPFIIVAICLYQYTNLVKVDKQRRSVNERHDIIHIHNNVLWDWHNSIEYSLHPYWIYYTKYSLYSYGYEEYSIKYRQSHIKLLWIWIMLWSPISIERCLIESKTCCVWLRSA